jgi:membrane-associated protein
MPGLAGMSRMNYRRFLVANALGGIIWGIAFTLLGYFAGTALTRIEKYASWVGLCVLIAMIVFFVVFHFLKKRRETNEEVEGLDVAGDSAEDLE